MKKVIDVLDVLKGILESDNSQFMKDENTEGMYYIPVYRERSDRPFEAERIQACWDAARENKEMKMEEIFERDVLKTAFDASCCYADLKADFTRAIGEAILDGVSVECAKCADSFDFDEWFSEHVYFPVFTSDWRRDIYTVCFDVGETLESFLAKHPDVDFRDALKRVYADTERDAAETVYYVGNMQNRELWQLSDVMNGDGKKIRALNVRLGRDDLNICLNCEFDTSDIRKVTIEEPDATAMDAMIK